MTNVLNDGGGLSNCVSQLGVDHIHVVEWTTLNRLGKIGHIYWLAPGQ